MRVLRVLVTVALLSGMAAAAQSLEGRQAPPFEYEEIGGRGVRVTLEAFKGRIVVIAFLRTGDSESMQLVEPLNRIHENYGKRGVVVFGAAAETRENIENIVRGRNMRFRVVFVDNTRAFEPWKISSYPAAYIIDPQGVVAWSGHPDDDLTGRIETQLQRTPPLGGDVASLAEKLRKAEQLRGEKAYGKAYTLAREVSSQLEQNDPSAEKARTLVRDLEQDASRWVDEAKEQARAEGGLEPACRILAEVSVRFEGSDAGKKARDEAETLKAGDRASRETMRVAMENARGALRVEAAAELEKAGMYFDALDIYSEVTQKYPGTEAARTSESAAERIRKDPKVQADLKKARTNEQADRWLDLGELYQKAEMYDLAKAQYQKVLDKHPSARAAAKARDLLAKLPKNAAKP